MSLEKVKIHGKPTQRTWKVFIQFWMLIEDPEKGLYQSWQMAEGGAVSGTASEYILEETDQKHEK